MIGINGSFPLWDTTTENHGTEWCSCTHSLGTAGLEICFDRNKFPAGTSHRGIWPLYHWRIKEMMCVLIDRDWMVQLHVGYWGSVLYHTPWMGQNSSKFPTSPNPPPPPPPPTSTSFLSQMKMEAVRVGHLAQQLNTVRAQVNKQTIL